MVSPQNETQELMSSRPLLILVFPLLAFASAQAQGTVQFRAILTGSSVVPPNSDPTIATGTFTLDGNSLSFLVDVPSDNFIPQSAYIQGPALSGGNGPKIFDLGAPRFLPGDSQGINPPGYRFFSPEVLPGLGAGPFPLTEAQITELESGLWYVNVTSAAFPNGQLRGQILEVPEPCTLPLLGLGIGFFVSRFRKRQK